MTVSLSRRVCDPVARIDPDTDGKGRTAWLDHHSNGVAVMLLTH